MTELSQSFEAERAEAIRKLEGWEAYARSGLSILAEAEQEIRRLAARGPDEIVADGKREWREYRLLDDRRRVCLGGAAAIATNASPAMRFLSAVSAPVRRLVTAAEVKRLDAKLATLDAEANAFLQAVTTPGAQTPMNLHDLRRYWDQATKGSGDVEARVKGALGGYRDHWAYDVGNMIAGQKALRELEFEMKFAHSLPEPLPPLPAGDKRAYTVIDNASFPAGVFSYQERTRMDELRTLRAGLVAVTRQSAALVPQP